MTSWQKVPNLSNDAIQAVAGDHWAGVGVLVAAKEGAWLLKPTRAPEKVGFGIKDFLKPLTHIFFGGETRNSVHYALLGVLVFLLFCIPLGKKV